MSRKNLRSVSPEQDLQQRQDRRESMQAWRTNKAKKRAVKFSEGKRKTRKVMRDGVLVEVH